MGDFCYDNLEYDIDFCFEKKRKKNNDARQALFTNGCFKQNQKVIF